MFFLVSVLSFVLGFLACAILAVDMLQRKGLMVNGKILDLKERSQL